MSTSFGGILYVDDTDERKGEFAYLLVNDDATAFTSLDQDGVNLATEYALTGTVKAGTIIPAKGRDGYITKFELSAGSVVAYKR